eukprot:TRINITY_DN1346_c0_g1_i1.p1 TRINITY_DN1346_c0_g1~~TRINITY_DN1346_c0_g1_i1.p1  ORF type:complete len:181 (-),score=31.10 TRINITY_DN1346_c0_g1_i1:226-768(-)
MRPTTIYGISKVYLELLGEYYHMRYGVDFRSLRYPGIISAKTLPGGGTTDYAIHIFHSALKEGKYSCFLKGNTKLPMMFMPDCIKATIGLLEAPDSQLTQRVYNVTGCSFTPEELANEIQKHISAFTISYNPDFRQRIADSWPNDLDDSKARADWGWRPDFDLSRMTNEMFRYLKPFYSK